MLAEYLQEQGRDDEAYEVLKAALVWWPMRYDDYRIWRTQLHTKLLGMAKRRGDKQTLRLLLDKVA